MPNGRCKSREILLLLFPCLLLLGAGAWLTYHQRSSPSGNSGTIHTVIADLEKVPVTPLEKWCGYDWKIVLHAQVVDGRNLLSSFKFSGNQWLTASPQLIWRKGKEERNFRESVRISSGNTSFRKLHTPLGFQYMEKQFLDEKMTLYCSSNNLPRGGEFFLRGEAQIVVPIQITTPLQTPIPELKPIGIGAQRFLLEPIPAKYEVPLRTYGPDNIEPEVNQTAPKIQHVQINDAIAPVSSQWHGRPQSDTVVKFELIPPDYLKDNLTGQIQVGGFQLIDSLGTPIPGHDEVAELNVHVSWDRIRKTKPIVCQFNFRRADLKLPSGLVQLRTYISYGDSWPAPLTIPIQNPNDWYHKRCDKELQLLTAKQDGNTVQVRLRYKGRKTLELRGEYWHDASEWARNGPEVKPGTEHLLSNWSQHLEKNGKQEDQFRVGVQNVTFSNDVVTITYYWPWPSVGPRWKPYTDVFHAKIGLRNKGFIPVSLPIKITTS